MNEENKAHQPDDCHLVYSMQVAVAESLNKVFFLGGSIDKNFNEFTDITVEWTLPSNQVRYKTRMPFKQFDFAALTSND